MSPQQHAAIEQAARRLGERLDAEYAASAYQGRVMVAAMYQAAACACPRLVGRCLRDGCTACVPKCMHSVCPRCYCGRCEG